MDNEKFRLALSAAARLVMSLPPGTVWAVCLTNEDDVNNPGVFNIYVRTSAERERMRLILNLQKPRDESPIHESYLVQQMLLVSIEQEEEE